MQGENNNKLDGRLGENKSDRKKIEITYLTT